MKVDVIVIAEIFEGAVKPITYELLGLAQQVAGEPAAIGFVMLGNELGGPAAEVAQRTGRGVLALEADGLAEYNGETWRETLTAVLKELRPAWVCIPHSSRGWDYAPALAARLEAACVTAVEAVSHRDGRLCFRRPVYGGKLAAEVCALTDTAVLTAATGAFKAPDPHSGPPGRVERRSVRCVPGRWQSQGLVAAEPGDRGLLEADVIVSAGRGIGKRENLDLIRRLAAVFAKSAVAGSRPLCDLGWLEYRCQVGVSGATVSPRLYLACGISGAGQHLSAIRGAGFIVAVNRDPQAAIFNLADVCVVEDLTAFIPAFLEACGREPQSAERNL